MRKYIWIDLVHICICLNKDNPAMTQAKANLAAAECMQQERAEQRRLERAEQKVWVEVEHLTKVIKEAERKRRELEGVELERLTQEKEKLEEEKRVEQQHAAALCRLERAAEWRQAALVASPPEAGLSRAPPQKPERTVKGANHVPGIIIPEKNCAQCIAQELLCQWDLDGRTWSC